MIELDRFGCLPQVTELINGKYDIDWCTFYINDTPYFIKWGKTYNIISMKLYDTGYVFTSMVISKSVPGNEISITFYCGNEKIFYLNHTTKPKEKNNENKNCDYV